MASESKVTKRRGFRFFFWVSATLFLLAAANWLFNFYIAISGSVSYLLGLVVLFLAILLVAELLNLAYTGIPNIRAILNGVLGLDKDGSLEPASTKESKTLSRAGQKFEKENKDIEMKKLDLASEEHRTRFYTALGAHLSILAAIAAAIISLSLSLTIYSVAVSNGTVSTTTPTPSVLSLIILAVLGILGFIVFENAFRNINQYKAELPRLNELIEDIENFRSIGTVEEALKRIEAPR